MCCGLEWDIRVLGVQNICNIAYSGIHWWSLFMHSRVQLETVETNINVQWDTMIYSWDRRKDLGKGAVIILNMSDGVCQFSDILVNFEFSSDSKYV